MSTIVLSGYFGAGNAGDEAILEAMLQTLHEELPQAELVVLSRDPAKTRISQGVSSLHRGLHRDLRAKLHLLGRADLLLSGGGGLLQDVYPRRIVSRSVLYYLGLCLLAKCRGCRVMFYAQGIGPLRRRINRWLTRRVADRMDLIAVRDEGSAALLRELGVGRVPVYVSADPALAWNPPPAGDVLARYAQTRGKPGDRLLAISVRPWPTGESARRTIARAADRAVREWQMIPVFVPLARGIDAAEAERVVDLMAERARAIILPDLSPSEIYGAITRCGLLVGMRLHSLIFAALGGVPMIGLSYDPKVREFLEALGLPGQVLPLGAEPEELWRKLAAARTAGTEIGAALAGSIGSLRARARDNARLARRLLEEGV